MSLITLAMKVTQAMITKHLRKGQSESNINYFNTLLFSAIYFSFYFRAVLMIYRKLRNLLKSVLICNRPLDRLLVASLRWADI
jgi:hypothetical protein